MVAIAKLLCLALTATAASVGRRDAVTVQKEITDKIRPQIKRLFVDVNEFPASGPTGAASNIGNDFAILIATFEQATTNIRDAGSFGIASGTAILNDLQMIVPTFLATFSAIGAQAASWFDLPDGQTNTLSWLEDDKVASDTYLSALVANQPFLLKAGTTVVQTQLSGAATATIAQYSS